MTIRRTPAERYKGMGKGTIDVIETNRTHRWIAAMDAIKAIAKFGFPSASVLIAGQTLDANWLNVLIIAIAVIAVAALVARLVVNRGEKQRGRDDRTELEEENGILRTRLGYPETGPIPPDHP